jgi:hypothetical protein
VISLFLDGRVLHHGGARLRFAMSSRRLPEIAGCCA